MPARVQAFPQRPDTYRTEPGLTIREYFAGQALAGLLGDEEMCGNENGVIADRAVRIADAVIERLRRESK